ncbi:cobalamin trafficking protein CblD-like [Panonychus citri]|uniref:cobalamin trafficking protein CblD-like n=1 Tax=Panonychus citri TaxID=50023 RepID=UPI002307C844|nr:cobalamin trafficking protein CblD-like [Panonychus citri]
MLRLGRLVILQRQGLETTVACAYLHNGRSSNSSKKSKRRDKGSSEEKITNREINLFDRPDARTPLPGSVGLVPPIRDEPRMIVNKKTITIREIIEEEQILGYLKETVSLQSPSEIPADELPNNIRLDMIVQKCPQLIENDLQKVFPYNVFGRDLTLITFNRRSLINNVDGDDEKIEMRKTSTETIDGADNLNLVDDFVNLADLICQRLKKAGYWADFIDPSVDWSQLRKPNNSMLIEVTVRYHQLGFTLETNGKCKVISHHKLGTNLYVGSLLTNASHDSPQLLRILELFRK